MAGTLATLFQHTEGLTLNIVASNIGGKMTMLITPKLANNPEANITPISLADILLEEIDGKVVELATVVFEPETQALAKTAVQVKEQLQKEITKAASNPANKTEVKPDGKEKTPLEVAAENGGAMPMPPKAVSKTKGSKKTETPAPAEDAAQNAADVVASLGAAAPATVVEPVVEAQSQWAPQALQADSEPEVAEYDAASEGAEDMQFPDIDPDLGF